MVRAWRAKYILSYLILGLSWAKIGVEGEVEGEGYSSIALNVTLYGCDLLDNRIGSLHTNFQILAPFSKKVMIFPPNFIHFHFKVKSESKY